MTNKSVTVEGPELDAAVAEAADPWCSVGMCASSGCIDIPFSAVGETAETDPGVLAVWKWNGERTWRTLPKFSTDLNAAFAAAEAAGLFGDGICLLQHRGDCEWRIWDDDEGRLIATGETPALAICAAILELKATSTGD